MLIGRLHYNFYWWYLRAQERYSDGQRAERRSQTLSDLGFSFRRNFTESIQVLNLLPGDGRQGVQGRVQSAEGTGEQTRYEKTGNSVNLNFSILS